MSTARRHSTKTWRLDGDFVVGDDFRGVQLTPHNSQASIIFGKGITPAKSHHSRPHLIASLEALLLVDEAELLVRHLDRKTLAMRDAAYH